MIKKLVVKLSILVVLHLVFYYYQKSEYEGHLSKAKRDMASFPDYRAEFDQAMQSIYKKLAEKEGLVYVEGKDDFSSDLSSPDRELLGRLGKKNQILGKYLIGLRCCERTQTFHQYKKDFYRIYINRPSEISQGSSLESSYSALASNEYFHERLALLHLAMNLANKKNWAKGQALEEILTKFDARQWVTEDIWREQIADFFQILLIIGSEDESYQGLVDVIDFHKDRAIKSRLAHAYILKYPHRREDLELEIDSR